METRYYYRVIQLPRGGLERIAPMSRGAADTSVRATLQPTFCDPVVLSACRRSLTSTEDSRLHGAVSTFGACRPPLL
jgi:hypothetical protein